MLSVVFCLFTLSEARGEKLNSAGGGASPWMFYTFWKPPGGGGTRAKTKILCLPFRSLVTVWRGPRSVSFAYFPKQTVAMPDKDGGTSGIIKTLCGIRTELFIIFTAATRSYRFYPVKGTRQPVWHTLVRETTEHGLTSSSSSEGQVFLNPFVGWFFQRRIYPLVDRLFYRSNRPFTTTTATNRSRLSRCPINFIFIFVLSFIIVLLE